MRKEIITLILTVSMAAATGDYTETGSMRLWEKN